MNRTPKQRLAAAAISLVITFSLVSAVAGLAKPANDAPLLAQAAVTVAMR